MAKAACGLGVAKMSTRIESLLSDYSKWHDGMLSDGELLARFETFCSEQADAERRGEDTLDLIARLAVSGIRLRLVESIVKPDGNYNFIII